MDTEYILKELKKSLDGDEDIESGLCALEEGGKADMLFIQHKNFGRADFTAGGSFFFAVNEGEEAAVFHSEIIVAEDIPGDLIPFICTEIAVDNMNIPAGRLIFDPESRNVACSLTVAIPESLTLEDALAQADNCAAVLLSLASVYAGKYNQLVREE